MSAVLTRKVKISIVNIHVLLLNLLQTRESLYYLAILLAQQRVICFFVLRLGHSETFKGVFVLNYLIFQSESSDFETLPLGLSLSCSFSEGKLLNIPRFFDKSDGFAKLPIVLLLRCEFVEIMEHELIF